MAERSKTLPLIKQGKRAVIAGRTGSGKTTLANWLIRRSPGRWIILNPKHTPSYNALPDAVIVNGLSPAKIDSQIPRHNVIIVNPRSIEAGADAMDDFIFGLHESWERIGLVCDELYTLHKNGVAGKGLLSWLTRGRELKQSFIGLTQRPVYVSQFVFSESDYICSMALQLEKDRKRMVEMTDYKAMAEKVPLHVWTWFDATRGTIQRYGPVPIAPG